jgi:hypothetical protein
MRILCPMCGFAREMDESKVPPRAQMATCPKCTHKFRFRVVDDLEPADAPFAPGSPQNVESGLPGGGQPGLDPMAAQRAAATEAWKRLQGPQTSPPAATQDGQGGETPTDAAANSSAQPLDSGAPLPTQAQQFGQPGQPSPPAQPDPTGQAAPWVVAQAERTSGSPVPFEDLPRHGFFPGLWATIRMLLTAPAAFFAAMPTHGGMAKPLAFHILLAEFMVVCQYLWGMAGIGATAEYLGSSELMDMGLGVAGAAPVLLFLVYPLLLVLRLMLMTGIIHLLLKMLRSGGSGAEATFRVLCYSAAPLLVGIIPGVGPLVGGAWSIVLTILGLKAAHRTQISAAMFAVLVPIMMMLAAVLGLLQGMVKGG